MEDADLVAAWRAGDRASGEALVERHFAVVARFFRNKADDALSDLVQKTFLAVIESPQGFRGQGSFRSYVLGIAYNILRRHYRDRNRDTPVDFEAMSIADTGVRPSAFVAIRQEQRCLLEALRRIPLEHQIVLELHYWESLSASAIGEIISAPEGTVRTRLRRAKQLLDTELSAIVGGGEALATTLARLDDWAREIRERLAGRAPSDG